MATIAGWTRCVLFRRLAVRNAFMNRSNGCTCMPLTKHAQFSSVLPGQNSLRSPTSIGKNLVISRNYYEKEKQKKSGPPSTVLATVAGVICGGVGLLVYYYGSLEEGQRDLYPGVFPVLAYLYRFRDNLHALRDEFAEPSSETLLPPPIAEPYIQPKYTLVMEIEDVLVHKEYDRNSGWRHQKRPGLDKFLKALSYPAFEVVTFTHEPGHNMAPIIEQIDPEWDIMHRLYRDSTKYTDGVHVKDLSRLGRDITKVILVDVDERTSMLQPRNSLILKRWDGDTGDISLMELIPFFHSILRGDVDDVRDVLDVYRNEDDPVAAFRRRQEQYQNYLEEMQQKTAQQQQRRSFFGGFLGRR